MKILYVVTGAEFGGPSRHVLWLAEHLSRQGQKVAISAALRPVIFTAYGWSFTEGKNRLSRKLLALAEWGGSGGDPFKKGFPPIPLPPKFCPRPGVPRLLSRRLQA